MATTGTSCARSNNGCWTCRVRKKKCDERRPSCSTCTSLALQCFGYSERPLWMDNGPLQKEQALRIKRIVGQNIHKRRKSRILSSTSLPFPGMDILDKKSLENPASSLDSSSAEVLPESSAFDETLPEDWSQFGSWSTDMDISSIIPIAKPLDTELTFDKLSWENGILTEDGSFDAHDPIHSESTQITQYSDPIFSPSLNITAVHNGGKIPDTMLEDGVYRGVDTISITEPLSLKYTPYKRSLDAVEAISKSPRPVDNLEDAMPQNEVEDNLLMHYLDEIFYIQFPFYNMPNRQSRGWLLSTVKRTNSVYNATLALSQYSLRSTVDASLPPTLSSKRNHYEIALRELGAIRESARKSSTLPRTTCILQLLFHELFAGGTGNWQNHLCLASSLIAPSVHASSRSTKAAMSHGDQRVRRLPRKQQDMESEPKDDIESQVILGSFIWLDILASASTRSVPSLKIDHRQILETFGINIQGLFGCSNRILELILDIVYLDNWKKDAEKTRQLSMVELVRRGAKIEDTLRRYSEELDATKSLESDLLRYDRSKMSPAQIEITHIFALSALTYLHVVISGAHPELPEIAESVRKTTDAFKSISDSRLLRNVVWPFCVTGCLATKTQQNFFRELVLKAEITSSSLGTCWQAFQIIEECWEVRSTCSYNCDWVFVMNKRSCNVLLA